jgi:hypothetical protein
MDSRPALIAALLPLGLAAVAPWPLTVPERTEFRRTSTVAEVREFVAALRKRAPGLVAYAPKGAPGATESGKPLLAWRLPATGKNAVRVYVNANIHAGEAEGKEAIQQILRELLQGKHPALRRGIDLVALPCYNADGTDALDPAIRPYQPNPEESGVGRRENAFGLDLNRDLMKAEAANTRWFLAMLQDFDPAVVFDLHTTNGSTHGFFLTHGPAMTNGADEPLLAFNRRMLVEVRERLNAEGLPTYDYGNFRPYRPTPEKPPEAWESYDAHPRLLTNYPALQGRLAVLSEAYVYRTWPQRIDDTRRFVLACLEWIAAHPQDVLASRQAAATRWTEVWKAGPPRLPLSAVFKEVERYPFDWVDPIRDAKGRVVGEKSRTRLVLPSFVGFEGRETVALPQGYLVDAASAGKIKDRLIAHGIKVFPGTSRPSAEPLLHFHEASRELSKGAYQGVFTLKLKGSWKAEAPQVKLGQPWSAADLDRALWIPLDQPLGRLAFYLLDPRSDDGFVYWGCFHSSLVRGDGMWGEPPRFPILAMGQPEMAPAQAGPAPGRERAE